MFTRTLRHHINETEQDIDSNRLSAIISFIYSRHNKCNATHVVIVIMHNTVANPEGAGSLPPPHPIPI